MTHLFLPLAAAAALALLAACDAPALTPAEVSAEATGGAFERADNGDFVETGTDDEGYP